LWRLVGGRVEPTFVFRQTAIETTSLLELPEQWEIAISSKASKCSNSKYGIVTVIEVHMTAEVTPIFRSDALQKPYRFWRKICRSDARYEAGKSRKPIGNRIKVVLYLLYNILVIVTSMFKHKLYNTVCAAILF
jgi:hypothetical protein